MNPAEAVEKLQDCIAKIGKLRALYDTFEQKGRHPEVQDIDDKCRLEISLLEAGNLADAVPVLAQLRQLGFKRKQAFEHGFGRCMVYVYEHEDGRCVWLKVFFATDGSCQFVRTGEKTEPVFELQCDGATVEEKAV